MTRIYWQRFAWLGLSGAILAGSFLGCYSTRTDELGACEPPAMAVDECTTFACPNGVLVVTPVPDQEKRTCFLGENEGVCVAGSCALKCETQGTPCKCASDTECPGDKQCLDWACDMGQCKSTQVPNGQVVDTLGMGDCKSVECQNGTPQTVTDDNDIPMDMVGDCKKPVCNNGTPATANNDLDPPADTGCVTNACFMGVVMSAIAPPGTKCATGFCNAVGSCVECLTREDWDLCGGMVCSAKLCTGAVCDTQKADVCQSGFCSDGICCDTACTDECKSCNVVGKVGTCSNIPFYESDQSYTDPVFMTPNVQCDSTAACNGNGKCLKRIGTACSLDADCLSGKCAQPAKVCLGAKDEVCTSNSQCASAICMANMCT